MNASDYPVCDKMKKEDSLRGYNKKSPKKIADPAIESFVPSAKS